jgi:hypothetical protein
MSCSRTSATEGITEEKGMNELRLWYWSRLYRAWELADERGFKSLQEREQTRKWFVSRGFCTASPKAGKAQIEYRQGLIYAGKLKNKGAACVK